MLRRFPNVPRLRVWPGRLSRLPPWVTLAVLATAGVAAVMLVPPRIAPELPDPQAQFEVVDRARLTVALIFGGLVALLGVYMNWRRVNTLERQVATAQLGQITERFTRAIDQLGAVRPDNTPAPEIRAGGVRSLERIAGESPEDFWPILDILSAYLRSESDTPPLEADGEALEQLEERAHTTRDRMDVAFAIEAIGRLWPRDRDWVPTPLSLAFVFAPQIALPAKNLQRANLESAYLERADLEGANLGGAELVGANLSGTRLQRAELVGANLSGARLQRAELVGASLEGSELLSAHLAGADLRAADLRRADLRGANLRGADLEGADLRGTDLRSADLREVNLLGTNHDVSTQWPEGFVPTPA